MSELLSPAGNMSCLESALKAGADAVYLAGTAFGARAFAGNFNNEQLIEASEKVHFLGKKLYVTVNTLVTDREMESALEFAGFLYQNKVCDGIIIQDIGLASEIKKHFPNLTLHGSTQMCVHSASGVLKASQLGMERVVIAREASREEIKKCVLTGVEIEAFVHGAYCVSQSGGCLMSSFIGKRSGNRGECAQPCRLPYEGGYHLSLKDMCLAKQIHELLDMGVASFKIEGRMKSPEYVYSVTKAYRALIDEHRPATKEEYGALEKIFSRSGFSAGYYLNQKGKNMFGVRREEDKLLTREAVTEVVGETEKSIDIFGFFGKERAYVTALCDSLSFTAEGECLTATGKGTEKDELIRRLSKTGGSGFKAENIEVSAEEGIFMPASAVNDLRRKALDGLKGEILNQNAPVSSQKIPEIKKEDLLFLPVKGDIYRIYEPERGFAVPSDAVRIDIPLWKFNENTVKRYDVSKISILLPRVITTAEEEDIKKQLEKAKALGVKRVTVTNIGHISLCIGFAVYGDGNLNATNTHTAKIYKEMGFSGVCVSPEVTPKAVKTDIGEYPVYGRQVLMHTENCIIKNISGCVKDCKAVLTDRTSARFPVWGEYNHRNLIFNSLPTYLLDKDVIHNRLFVITDEKEIPSDKPKEFTRGYWK